jgi:polyferredoxin
MATITSKRRQSKEKASKALKISKYDPHSHPFTWLRGLRLSVNILFLLLFNGVLLGLSVTWLTLPVNAPPTPFSISEGTLYVLQLMLIEGIIPFIPLATIFLVGGLVGRFFCGWACPVGAVQEILAYIPVRKIYPSKHNNERGSEIALYFVGIVLVLVAFIGITRVLSIQSTESDLKNTFGIFAQDPLTALDPAATLFTFIPYMIYWDRIPGISIFAGNPDLFWFWFRLAVLIVVFSIPAFIPRAYCRYICPTGAIMGKFGKYSLLGIKRNPILCNECGDCDSICPMGVRVMDYADKVKDPLCIGCMDCAYVCEEGAIQLKIL